MAQPITCDLCAEGVLAVLMMTQMQSGETLGICARCSPTYLTLLRNSICDQLYGDHPSESAIEDFLNAQDIEPEPEPEPATPWPHTAHSVPSGARKRRQEREQAAAVQETEADELSTGQPLTD